MAEGRRDRARVFFALWPDAEVARELAAMARDAQAECGGRATATEKIHLTLFYVGDVERTRVAALTALAESIEAHAFDLVVSTVGYWRHNRIVWAGTVRCPERLAVLVSRLRARLAADGIHGEERSYVPHVTLVRNASRAPQRTSVAPLTWPARSFVLAESVPAAAGVRYDVIGRWPLVAAG